MIDWIKELNLSNTLFWINPKSNHLEKSGRKYFRKKFEFPYRTRTEIRQVEMANIKKNPAQVSGDLNEGLSVILFFGIC